MSLAAGASALAALLPLIEDTVNRIIADNIRDDEIMAAGRGRNSTFTRHFNELVDPKYRNNQDMIRRAYSKYKQKKGL
jgi:hypothetical protein